MIYASESFEEKYKMKARGYDFNRVASRVVESMGVSPEQVTAFGRSPRTVEARALLWYWAHQKLGMTATEIAKRLKIGQPAVSRLWRRGEQIEKECMFCMIDG